MHRSSCSSAGPSTPSVLRGFRRWLTALALAGTSLVAADWPHWLGPNGNNRAPADGFDPDLAKYGEAWTAAIGKGYASVAVAEGRAFCLGHDGQGNETVFAFDAASGKQLWKLTYPAELLPRMHPGGPNATPTVAGKQVLTLSKDGQLHCLLAADGTKRWSVRLPSILGADVPQWGFGSSPVVDGNRVYISAGKLACLDLESGKSIWVSPEARPAAYATPVPFVAGGRRYVAAMNGRGLSIHDADDGAEVAHRPLKAQFDLLAPTPLIVDAGKRVFISANASSELLDFDGKSLTVVWTTTELRNALNNSVIADGTIYGIDGRQGTAACRLVALNLADGKTVWAKDQFGYGTTIGVGDTLLALTETGELVAARLSTAGYTELGRRQVLGKTCWTTPTLAAGRIYARNDQGQLVCLARK